MKKILLKLLVCLVVVSLFTGCEGGLFNPEGAITAPENGIYQGVYDALQQAIGKEIVLKYPAVQGVHTAYYPWDLDADGVNEVLVFYQLRSKIGVTRVHLLKQNHGKWESFQELDAVGTDVLHVDLCDLNGDKTPELCIGWSVATTNSHVMSVFQVENGMLLQRAGEEYNQYVICDINNDRIQDLGLAVLSGEAKTSTLRFYTLKTGAVTVLGSIGLDGNVLSYGKITAAGITAQKSGVYLDVYKGTDSMITELVYMKDDKLYNPFAGTENNINIATLRYCDLPCGDINQDGVIEIPFMVQLPGYTQTGEETEDRDITHYVIDWRYYGGDLSDSVASWFYNAPQDYYLELDSSWQGKFTVLTNSQQNESVFYSWLGNKVGNPLLTVKRFTVEEYAASAGFEKLHQNETHVWAARIEDGKHLPMGYEELKQKFHYIVK